MKRIPFLITLLLVMLQKGNGSFSEGDYGLGALQYLLDNDSETFCHYVTCQENVAPNECPDGTHYIEGVAQFGCCGSCVRFKQFNDSDCTGSIDPKYGGGYSKSNPSTRNLFLESFTYNGDISILLPSYNNTLFSSWCDYNMECGGSTKRCESNSTDFGCTFVLQKYLDDLASGAYVDYRDDYRWPPSCAADGMYKEKQCKGPLHERRCVCVDPTGNRLYGSAFEFQKDLYENMNCKCSRRVWERQQQGESSVTLHCAENGNYESLQCEKGWCYCMDPLTAEPYGPNLPEAAMNLLPCYNASLVGRQYLRRCESQFHAHSTLIELMAYKNVNGPSTRLECDPDGSYNAIQCDNVMCRCYTKYAGEPISYPSGDGCQCVRDRELFTEAGVDISVTCDGNSGTYKQIQQTGLSTNCVDEDGVRNGPRVWSEYATKLDCENGILCQNSGEKCEKACNGCPDSAYVNYKP